MVLFTILIGLFSQMAKGKKGEIKTSCQYPELQQTQLMQTKPWTACSRLLYSPLFKVSQELQATLQRKHSSLSQSRDQLRMATAAKGEVFYQNQICR